MRPFQQRQWWMALLLMGLLAVARPAAAFEGQPGPVRKLSRGLANTFAGVLEIPLTISEVGRVEGPVAALSLGLLMGTGAAVTRTLVGVAEVITFPIPLTGVGYEPLLQPEFLLRPTQPHEIAAQTP